MSTETACLLFGIAAVFFWIRGLRKGIMLGRTGWVRREEDSALFWLYSLLSGSVALGLLITPILVWMGLKE